MGKKGRAQQERRVVDMSTPALQEDIRWSPDPAQVEDWPFVTVLLDLGRLIGRQGLDAITGRMVEFAIIAQVDVADRWIDVARVDTCHEEVHLHLKSRTGAEIGRNVLRTIYSPNDVERGWDEGEAMLLARWDEHVRRWSCGR